MGLEPIKSDEDDHDPEKVTSDRDFEALLTSVSYGDLYALGRLWVRVLKTALLGTELTLFPVVKAAQKPPPQEGPPKKPDPMKYTDLPLYATPHYDYKDHQENIYRCPKVNKKLLQEYLLPHVNALRKSAQKTYCCIKCTMKEKKNELCDSVRSAKKEFKKTMRDPENLMMRRGVVALGATTGLVLGSGRGLPRRIFYTGLGTLAAGALCFPKETDEAFRTLSYHTAKAGLAFYNLICGKGFMFRERLMCKEDLPPPPPVRKVNTCPKKEK